MVKTFLKARWENLIMANYSIDAELLMPFLPKGVELDLYDGKAYVSLVGFIFKRSRIFNIPIPLMGTSKNSFLNIITGIPKSRKMSLKSIKSTTPDGWLTI